MNYQYISTDEMKALESLAVEKFEIPMVQMMQKAGRAVFDVVMNEVMKQNLDQNILVVAGKGNNSGDALVATRLLHEKGVHVVVLNPYSTGLSQDAGVPFYKSNRVMHLYPFRQLKNYHTKKLAQAWISYAKHLFCG